MNTKRPRKPIEPRFVAICSTTIPRPGVNPKELPPGMPVPQIIVTQLIDHLGRRWIDDGEGAVLVPFETAKP